MRKTIAALLCLLCTGCSSFRGKSAYNEPVVYGERINIVKPGDIIEIPQLKRPASTWYLVDDVGLSIWLGIPMQNIPGTKTPYEQAIDTLTEIESEVQ